MSFTPVVSVCLTPLHTCLLLRLCLLPFLIPAAKLSVKQSGKAGGWPTFLPIEAQSIVQYVPVCALLFLSLLRSDTPNPLPSIPPHPGSLAADWVVIVIKSSCTASEYTKLSANGWSSVGGWPAEGGGHGHCPLTHTLSAHCLPSFLYYVRPAPGSKFKKYICNTSLALEEEL